MAQGKQAGKTAKVLLNETDLEACERIIARNPTVLNVTDAVRRAIHFTDRAESTSGVAA